MKLHKLFVLAALLAASCFYFFSASSTENRTWNALGVTRLFGHTVNGAITVTGKNDTIISAEIIKSCRGTSSSEAKEHLADIEIFDSLGNNGLQLRAAVPIVIGRDFQCEFNITNPTDFNESLETSNGAIKVSNINGSLWLRTSNGAVTLTDCNGTIDLGTSNGAVTLTNTTGSTIAATSNGAITANSHHGSLNAVTSNGAANCEFAQFDSGSVGVVYTSNGQITVLLPADVSLAFDASASNGTVYVQGFSVNYTKDDKGHKVGTIGTGAATLTLGTSNGNITIKANTKS